MSSRRGGPNRQEGGGKGKAAVPRESAPAAGGATSSSQLDVTPTIRLADLKVWEVVMGKTCTPAEREDGHIQDVINTKGFNLLGRKTGNDLYTFQRLRGPLLGGYLVNFKHVLWRTFISQAHSSRKRATYAQLDKILAWLAEGPLSGISRAGSSSGSPSRLASRRSPSVGAVARAASTTDDDSTPKVGELIMAKTMTKTELTPRLATVATSSGFSECGFTGVCAHFTFRVLRDALDAGVLKQFETMTWTNFTERMRNNINHKEGIYATLRANILSAHAAAAAKRISSPSN